MFKKKKKPIIYRIYYLPTYRKIYMKPRKKNFLFVLIYNNIQTPLASDNKSVP